MKSAIQNQKADSLKKFSFKSIVDSLDKASPEDAVNTLNNLNLSSGLKKEILEAASNGKHLTGSLTYRYTESGLPFPDNYTSLENWSILGDTDDDIMIAFSAEPFVNLNDKSNKSFDFEFLVTDMVTSVIETVTVEPGTPLMFLGDNGQMSVGMLPEWEVDAKLQVSTDILATDSSGNQRLVLSEIDKLASDLSLNNSDLIKQLYLCIHPVGDIVMNTSGQNPQETFGGIWTAWGTGRVPVGVDISQTEFAAVEKTGGHKNLQSHTHAIPSLSGSTASNSGTHSHHAKYDKDAAPGTAKTRYYPNGGTTSSAAFTPTGGGHAHTLTTNASNTGSSGSGNAQNLQPYITCYFWKRTA